MQSNEIMRLARRVMRDTDLREDLLAGRFDLVQRAGFDISIEELDALQRVDWSRSDNDHASAAGGRPWEWTNVNGKIYEFVAKFEVSSDLGAASEGNHLTWMRDLAIDVNGSIPDYRAMAYLRERGTVQIRIPAAIIHHDAVSTYMTRLDQFLSQAGHSMPNVENQPSLAGVSRWDMLDVKGVVVYAIRQGLLVTELEWHGAPATFEDDLAFLVADIGVLPGCKGVLSERNLDDTTHFQVLAAFDNAANEGAVPGAVAAWRLDTARPDPSGMRFWELRANRKAT